MEQGATLSVVIGCALAAISLYVATVVIPRTRARMRRLVRTEGVIEGFVWGALGKGLAGQENASGLPKIRYRDAAGRTRHATPRIGQSKDDRGGPAPGPHLAEGGTVPIRYDPEQPDWIMVEGLPDPLRSYWLLAGVTGVMGVGTLFMGLH